jgi:predicted SprT family Zn-dependent metalloprotease
MAEFLSQDNIQFRHHSKTAGVHFLSISPLYLNRKGTESFDSVFSQIELAQMLWVHAVFLTYRAV